jgi:hypothetical protein
MGDEVGRYSLAISRDECTGGPLNTAIQNSVAAAVEAGSTTPMGAGQSLQLLQVVLEDIRQIVVGRERTIAMNTFVRTLGERPRLACFLQHLNASLTAESNGAGAFATLSQAQGLHCLYGWAGQTLVLHSRSTPTPATETAAAGLGEFLGYSPTEWFVSIHIWQPNPGAFGFASVREMDAHAVAEPPHSHPYDFASHVAIGEIRETIYAEAPDAVSYERVDGVWPPHYEQDGCGLGVLEERVVLRAGDSYFMSREAIHDVEVDRRTAASKPAITLFLASEAVVKPHAFLSESMAKFHNQHPALKETGEPLSAERWSAKLDAVVRYLKGEIETLDLSDIVQCSSDYGFLAVGKPT